jgi:outer membrane protein OmpA-like peptidoglycan-associated protein
MNSQFSVARLSPDLLSELKQLEERLRSDANENIVLVAYSEETGPESKD